MTNIFWHYERNNLAGGIDTHIFTARHDRKLRCVVSGPTIGQNNPSEEWHLSISHPDREPTHDEIDSAITAHIPEEVPMNFLENAMLKTINNAKSHQHRASIDASLS